MKKSYLAAVSGFAFAAAVAVTTPYVWAQAASGTASGEKSGTDKAMQKTPDTPETGSSKAGTSRETGREGRMTSGQGRSNDKVKQVQEALKQKGFDPGMPDGAMGPKTTQALREFQKSQNLQVTGRVDEKTASALGVESAGMSGSSGASSRASKSGSSSSATSSRPDQTGSEPADPTKPGTGSRGGTKQ
jgi:peptidoglycan hydrolase-like protein with peptidoglycan-binding domain